MDNNELLHSISQMMEAQEKRTDEKFSIIEQKLDTMQEDINHITKQVDIAYKWVDMIDLRVRALER